MDAGPTTMAWAADEEEVNQGGQGTTGETVGESRFQIDHLGVKRMMEDQLGEKCKMLIRIWDLHRVKGLTVKRIVLGQKEDDKNHTADDILWNAKAALILGND
ncbi:hypothetical protein Bca52824_073179 [Brassica carinata]|uniref:Uncharacterized protein n=1 Tax=Brassica carinata TaxID=52824 RepID=A0A8X7U4L4_BRACI|nr:hypothetical protein Bca52824_073179 [Brassica carinata]